VCTVLTSMLSACTTAKATTVAGRHRRARTKYAIVPVLPRAYGGTHHWAPNRHRWLVGGCIFGPNYGVPHFPRLVDSALIADSTRDRPSYGQSGCRKVLPIPGRHNAVIDITVRTSGAAHIRGLGPGARATSDCVTYAVLRDLQVARRTGRCRTRLAGVRDNKIYNRDV